MPNRSSSQLDLGDELNHDIGFYRDLIEVFLGLEHVSNHPYSVFFFLRIFSARTQAQSRHDIELLYLVVINNRDPHIGQVRAHLPPKPLSYFTAFIIGMSAFTSFWS
jgi:hypothetical protein